jgi:beta-galactosidase/beta-glucuronidase
MFKRCFIPALCLTASAFAAVPRPEFPEPQFERGAWLSLNGPWQFAFDDADEGIEAHWFAGDHNLASTITVPFCFESKLSGIGDTGFHPWVWYRREVTLPETKAGASRISATSASRCT